MIVSYWIFEDSEFGYYCGLWDLPWNWGTGRPILVLPPLLLVSYEEFEKQPEALVFVYP